MSAAPHRQVLLERVAVEKDRDDAAEENQRLRALLKQYLDGSGHALYFHSFPCRCLSFPLAWGVCGSVVLSCVPCDMSIPATDGAGISVSEDVLSQANTLLIVNQRSNIPCVSRATTLLFFSLFLRATPSHSLSSLAVSI